MFLSKELSLFCFVFYFYFYFYFYYLLFIIYYLLFIIYYSLLLFFLSIWHLTDLILISSIHGMLKMASEKTIEAY
jgi:hypothetical protein